MAKKETVTQEDLFEVLDMIEQLGIRYWLDGGWGAVSYTHLTLPTKLEV